MTKNSDESKNVTTRESGEMRRREPESWLRPSVDIFEDAEGITLVADMPGVNKDRLNLQAENESLIVEGEASIHMPEGMEALYADVRATRYRRSFGLSRELDIDEIDASLKDGVLRVRIPKTAEMRPRKIEVRM
jgi:HSP20 family molecular chaperone IbpA